MIETLIRKLKRMYRIKKPKEPKSKRCDHVYEDVEVSFEYDSSTNTAWLYTNTADVEKCVKCGKRRWKFDVSTSTTGDIDLVTDYNNTVTVDNTSSANTVTWSE